MRNNRQILIFQIISWVIAYIFFGVITFLYDEARIGLINEQFRGDLFFTLRLNIIVGILVGLALGSIDIFLKNISNERRSFRFYIITKSVLYTIAFIVILNVIVLGAASNYLEQVLKLSLGVKESKIIRNIIFILTLYSILVSILISFLAEVNKKFGPGILLRLFLGKYHSPKVEERIFMFLDLKSSTVYAEKLGHIKYSQLIQDCFNDLNTLVLKYKAEIYQYVGDEAVLTWIVDRGFEHINYLRFYFAFQNKINGKSNYYKEKYGLVPEFKAGVNGGNITVTEVGDIKREIAYHGDVINTAARIQEKCNTYNQKLLISEFLANKTDSDKGFAVEEIGQVTLKGKELPVKIFSVDLHT